METTTLETEETKTFSAIFIPYDETIEVSIISLPRKPDYVKEIYSIFGTDVIKMKYLPEAEKSEKGGMLICQVIHPTMNKRASYLSKKPVYGNVILVDVYFVDCDENGNVIPGYDVYVDLDLSSYHRYVEIATNRLTNKSFDPLSKVDAFGQTFRNKINSFPSVYNATEWKGQPPKSIFYQLVQVFGWKNIQFVRSSVTAQGPHKVKLLISDIDFECAPQESFPTVKEAENNASLLALKELVQLQMKVDIQKEKKFNRFHDDSNDSEDIDSSKSNVPSFDNALPLEKITEDGGIVKQILKEGEGIYPPPKSRVTIHYRMWDSEKQELIDSTIGKNPFSFRLGKGKVIPALDISTQSMKTGELALFLCSTQYTFGPMGLQIEENKIVNSDLLIEIDLVEFEHLTEANFSNLPSDMCYEQAKKEKIDGNVWFKQNSFKKALHCYHRACGFMSPKVIQEIGSIEKSQNVPSDSNVYTFLTQLYTNCALVHSKEEKWEKVIESCSKALSFDPTYSKALFFRAKGYRYIQQFELAQMDLERLPKNDTNVMKEWKNLKLDQKKHATQEQEIFKKMLPEV